MARGPGVPEDGCTSTLAGTTEGTTVTEAGRQFLTWFILRHPGSGYVGVCE